MHVNLPGSRPLPPLTTAEHREAPEIGRSLAWGKKLVDYKSGKELKLTERVNKYKDITPNHDNWRKVRGLIILDDSFKGDSRDPQ